MHRAAESVRVLRTNLELAAISNDAKTIMVTSAAPGEGKSTTVANLAVALARSGHKVALVDLDLREPSVARAFDLEGRPGITDVTMERVMLEEALTTIPLDTPSLSRQSTSVISSGGLLDVLPAGTIPPDPGEFVGAHRLALVLRTIAQRHDFVLIDSPPILAVGDGVSLSTIVDAMFVVVRLDVIDRRTLREMSRAVSSCPCATLGFVLTNVEAKELYGTAHYGHDARGSDDTRTPLRGVAATPR
jgi:capsular exopolysaccharide synthesis family protein